ncbi:MAG: hypothetical protein ACI88H_003662, partial [Cocleimonas sp.]
KDRLKVGGCYFLFVPGTKKAAITLPRDNVDT